MIRIGAEVHNRVMILICGGGGWVLTEQLKNRLQAVEMKFLRGVKDITRRGRLLSDMVRMKLEVELLIKRIATAVETVWTHGEDGTGEMSKKVWQVRGLYERRR